MRVGAAVSVQNRIDSAIQAVLADAIPPLQGERPNLALLFASNHFEEDLPRAAAEIRRATNVQTLLGCTGEGIIGTQAEVEREPALALWLASLPDTRVIPIRLSAADIQELADADDFAKKLGVAVADHPSFILLADPFSFPMVDCLNALNEHFPGAPVVGGMASGADKPNQSVLLLDDESYNSEAVGIALCGKIRIQTVVSQGCRPIGKPFVITSAQHNIVKQLGGRPALSVLQEVFAAAEASERKLMEQGVFVGQVINEYKATFERGDFLVRHMIGADPNSGALAIGDYARPGRTIQFHVRDAQTADEDLKAMLAPHAKSAPAAALLFTCNGRGRRMFPGSGHDLHAIHTALGSIPVAGFFCAGELGPIGSRNFIHGHTASIALFTSS